jgi:hypothetical protein
MAVQRSRKIVETEKKANTDRCRGSLKSMRGNRGTLSSPERRRRRRSTQIPMGIRKSPKIINAGKIMYVRMPTYGFVCSDTSSSKKRNRTVPKLTNATAEPTRLTGL